MKKFGDYTLRTIIFVWGLITFMLALVVVVGMTVFKLPKIIGVAFVEAFRDFDRTLDKLTEKEKA